MISVVDKETRDLLRKGGYWGKAAVPFTGAKLTGSPREQYRQLTMRTGKKAFPWELAWKVVVFLLLVKTAFSQQAPARATALPPVYGENKLVPLSVDLTGALRTSGGGGSGGGLTDAQLRASPVPMSLATVPLAADAATETTLGLIYGRLPALVTGRIPVDGSGVTQPVSISGAVPVTGTFWQATQPVSGTVTANAGTGTMAVSATSLPLPALAATSTKQPALGTAGAASADVITVQGIAAGTPMRVDLAATGSNATALNVTCVSGCSSAAEVATYTWTTPDVVAGSNKLFLDIFNASGSAKVIKVRGIYPIMKTDVAVVGVLGLRFDLFRTSAVGTGGTPAVYQSATRDVAGGSIVPLDFNNPSLPAQITARHLPAGGATAAAWLRRGTCFVEETNAATYWCNGSFNFLTADAGGQPLVLREGQGLLIQQGSIATLNNIAFTVVFSVE